MQKSPYRFIQNYRLELVVFLGGMMGMILEVVGSRVVSPYFGNSLIVWTNLIGVILGCLSAGYYFGGKLADKYPTYENLGKLILAGASALTLTSFLKEPILSSVQFMMGSDLRSGSFFSILILFGPASVMLGMIAPYAARLRMGSINSSGKVVGNLYALSTVGSIAGTFMAGFYLIPAFGNSDLIYTLTYGLIFLSVVTMQKIRPIHLLLTILLTLLFFLNRTAGVFRIMAVADIDSLYNRILIKQMADQELNKVIMMTIDNAGVQSAVMPESPDELYLDYARAYRVASEIKPDLKKALMIGGGGYSVPRDFLKRHPLSEMDVVEIDSEITEMARKYFFLTDNPRLHIFHQDARSFLNRSESIYEVVFLDAFNALTPPANLTTIEFMTNLKNHLTSDGFVMINLISSISGPNSIFFELEQNTLAKVFPQVEAYRIGKASNESIQNLIIIAYKEPNDKLLSLGRPIPIEDKQTRILTDDWSPVEFLTREYYAP